MFSAEARQHLVRMVCLDGKNVTDAAHCLRLSERSARRFLRYFMESGGEFHHDPEQWNRHANNVEDDPTLRDAVLSAVREQPELFMDELAAAVNALTVAVDGAVQVSPASVGRISARNGYTRKIIEKAFFTRNEAQRVAWVASQWQIPLRCRVYVDEAHRVGRAAERRWAWSVRGTRSGLYVASSAGAKTSFFFAMAHDRVLDWFITRPPPGQTSVDFLIFLTTLVLPRMTACVEGDWAEQPPRCVLVLDNARIHDEVALQRVRAAGVFVLLLPPYSPDFNPIEDVFSVGSSWLRRWCSPDQFNAWPMTTVDSMLLHITGNMCRGFVRAAVRRYNLYVP